MHLSTSNYRRAILYVVQSPELVTTTEAAEALGIDRTTVTRLASAGTLDVAMKAPGRNGALFFRRDAVTALAAARHKASA